MSDPPDFVIRPATDGDDAALWRILEPTIRAGETYPLPRDMTRSEALSHWFSPGHEVFVAEERGALTPDVAQRLRTTLANTA